MKTKIIPFDLETAKKIQAGEIEGRIVTDKGASARILCYDFKCGEYSIGAAISVRDGERFCCITNSGLRSAGEQMNDGWFDKLLIELPEETTKPEFTSKYMDKTTRTKYMDETIRNFSYHEREIFEFGDTRLSNEDLDNLYGE